MKTRCVLFIVLIVALCACTTKQEAPASVDINFTVNKIVPFKHVPRTIRDSLKKTGVMLGSPDQAEIGFLFVKDTSKFIIGSADDNIMLTYTNCPFDDTNSLLFVFAVNPFSIVDNSMIESVTVEENDVRIAFNEEGKEKWAEFTRKSSNCTVAFLLDEKISYWMPIEGENSEGVVNLTGLKSAEDAQALAGNLTKNLP